MLTKIETGVVSDTAPQGEGRTRLLPVSDYSIAELVQKVNTADENFFKYIPDELLMPEQIEAKRRALAKEAKKYGTATTTEAIPKTEKTMRKEGSVRYVEGFATPVLSAKQKTSLRAINVLSTALGVDFVIHESIASEGKYKNANGWYDPKTGEIHIALDANRDGTMLFTVAHELTHLIRDYSPQKFKVFADIVVNRFCETEGVSFDALIENQKELAQQNGRKLSFDKAYEEVVASACESMLSDGEAMQEISLAVKKQDASLWKRIERFLSSIVERIREEFFGVFSHSQEGHLLASMQETAEEVRRLWTEALIDATENMGSSQAFWDGEAVLSFGVTQQDINEYVDNAYEKKNTEDYKPYAEADGKLITDVAYGMDITGYVHALRDNDIRHIRNSHGENTNEKYPVTKEDVAQIPYIVANYDKVFVKSNANGDPGLVYVKVGRDNVTYYVEAITTQYHNQKLLVNKQMVKTGISEIPNLNGLIQAITKKESSSQYLADLEKIRKAYVQDVKENYSTNSITDSEEKVKRNATNSSKESSEEDFSSNIPYAMYDFSERGLLFRMLEQVAQSDEEKKLLNEYSKELKVMNEEQEYLASLKKEYRALYGQGINGDYTHLAQLRQKIDRAKTAIAKCNERIREIEAQPILVRETDEIKKFSERKEEIQKKLSDMEAEEKRLIATKIEQDYEYLSKLRQEIIKTQNRINLYDKEFSYIPKCISEIRKSS